MKAIKIPVNGEIDIIDVPDSEKSKGDFLHACQSHVGGLVEIVRPRLLYSITMMPPTACMLCNEDFIAKRMPINRRATELYGAHSICGDILIVDQIRTPDGYDITGFGNIAAEAICHVMKNRFKGRS